MNLSNDVERLSCYDLATEKLTRGQAAGDALITPESVFGVKGGGARNAPAQPVEREELGEITSLVAAIRNRAAATEVELKNGQVWRLDNAPRLLLQVGDEVTIKRAAMKSFKLLAPDGRFTRVKRVR
ncbi:MAG: hypothetical protein RBS02_14075 [Steroidobacteraceae bacterium]|nr:hypothetical protein [Steroidobacteraceae bacterium]